jgi:hypothetical protein
MADNFNDNSLSDILNDNTWDFGEMRGNDTDGESEIEALRSQLAFAQDMHINPLIALDPRGNAEMIKMLQDKIAEYERKQSVKRTSYNPNRSLYDKTAFIDYARYVHDGDWDEYKRGANREYELNGGLHINRPVPGDEKVNISMDGLSIHEIIKWSEDYPALQLRFQDFVYCKNLGVLPNNRLIVLRRFRNGVPDNLFNHHANKLNKGESTFMQPIATMVSWLKPEENFISMSFSEQWRTNQQADIFSLFKEAYQQVSGGNKGAQDKSGDFFNTELLNFSDTGVIYSILNALGYDTKGSDGTSPYTNEPGGNPNLVRNSATRVVGGGGLSSNVGFTLKFEYEMRYIRGVDPGIAMLDLISNSFRMGTSVSQFRLDMSVLKSENLKKIINNDFQIEWEKFAPQFMSIMGNVYKETTDFLANGYKYAKKVVTGGTEVLSDETQKFVDGTAKHIISRYREAIKAALSAETGMASGIWHVTIGNPKNPVISCGDLVITTSTLELGKELGYNDFPTTFSYSITLASARERGRNELERIFNAGRGRVYVYKKTSDNPDYYISEKK